MIMVILIVRNGNNNSNNIRQYYADAIAKNVTWKIKENCKKSLSMLKN